MNQARTRANETGLALELFKLDLDQVQLQKNLTLCSFGDDDVLVLAEFKSMPGSDLSTVAFLNGPQIGP